MAGKTDDALAGTQALLAPFLSLNPSAVLHSARVKAGEFVSFILKPWGDESLAIDVIAPSAALVEALNSLYFPPRLSALWHSDSKDLEIIWTARKLSEGWNEIKERKFNFKYRGINHTCHFTTSSDRLLSLANAMRPLVSSNTSFRNMRSFSEYVTGAQKGEKDQSIAEPLSFWISKVEWDEVSTIELVEALNFYLTYYDFKSPVIIVHDPVDDTAKSADKTRYLRGSFPKTINAKPLDQNLTAFWDAAGSATPLLSFILYYRIIEYASSHYIDSTIRTELSRILSAPDLTDDIHGSVDQIVSSLGLKNLEEVPRFKAVIRNNVNSKLIWKDVKENIAAFSKETKFDGGFTVKPLCSGNDKEASFCNRGLDQFSDSIRKIRNTLSHGKDQETAGMILPTARNISLLRPWVHLIATVAGEVVLYKDVS